MLENTLAQLVNHIYDVEREGQDKDRLLQESLERIKLLEEEINTYKETEAK